MPATVTIVSPFVSVYVHAALFGMLSCVATLKTTAPEASVTVVAVLLKPAILPTTVVVVASVVSPMPPTVDLLDAAATGAVFWPDFWKTDPANPIFRLTDTEPSDFPSPWEQESGQLLVDKSKAWRALNLASR